VLESIRFSINIPHFSVRLLRT